MRRQTTRVANARRYARPNRCHGGRVYAYRVASCYAHQLAQRRERIGRQVNKVAVRSSHLVCAWGPCCSSWPQSAANRYGAVELHCLDGWSGSHERL